MNAISNLWIKSSKISTLSKEYIIKMNKKEIEDAFNPNKMKFGTAGIRQIMGPGTNRMNAFTYQQISHGYAQYILSKNSENPKVVIGHDNRTNADMFSIICARVLTSFGIEVYLFNNNKLIPTPIVSYAINHYGFDGGIVVTASHNPKNYLGFKAYNETGAQILPDEAKIIEQNMPQSETILNNEYKYNQDLIQYLSDSVIKDYFIDARSCLIHTDISKRKEYPIVFTAHHGTASQLMPQFLSSLGYLNVVSVKQQCVPDANFTFSKCSNPEDPSSFELSEKYAFRVGADIMLGVDPDADRLAVAIKHNGAWRYLTGNEMGIIFAHYVLTNKDFQKKPYIVSTYVSTYLINSIARTHNALINRVGTGFKWHGNLINEKINTGELVVAFEEAIGSLNSTINRDKDSFQAAALALEIYDLYKEKSMTLVDLLEKEIYPKYGYWAGGTISYTFQSMNWQNDMDEKLSQLASIKNPEVGGIKVLSNRWNSEAEALEWNMESGMWIKFRKSGTEPKFKIYYNVYGNDLEEAQSTYEIFKKEISNLMRM